MKRALRWNDGDDDDTSSSSSEDCSTPLANSEGGNGAFESKKRDAIQSSKLKTSQDSAMKKKKSVNFEALSKHGYRGGLSVLSVPAPKEPEKEQDWSWSKGKETRPQEAEESFEERQRTRDTLADAELLLHVQTQKEKKNLSFQQKEKRKRDLGQASRGKNYVEEEKRLLRDNGVYSGFDS